MTDPMGLSEAAPAYNPREESYDRAMARAQWEGSDLMHANSAAGAIGIGRGGYDAWSANGGLSMALESRQVAAPKTFRSELAAANAHKDETLSLMQRDKKEYGAETFQKPDGSENWIAGKPRPGNGVKYVNERKGYFQTFTPNRDAKPPPGYEGYLVKGFYFGHFHHDPSAWQYDKSVAQGLKMNATLFMPRQRGDYRPPASLYYNHDDPP